MEATLFVALGWKLQRSPVYVKRFRKGLEPYGAWDSLLGRRERDMPAVPQSA